MPSETARPSALPTNEPTKRPTRQPSFDPTYHPTIVPTVSPTLNPTAIATSVPIPPDETGSPTVLTEHPTITPSLLPSAEPTSQPTFQPTPLPSGWPSYLPTLSPTEVPTNIPTPVPTWQWRVLNVANATLTPTQKTDEVVQLYIEKPIEELEDKAIERMKLDLAEIMDVDSAKFTLEFEVFAGSSVIRVIIRPAPETLPSMQNKTAILFPLSEALTAEAHALNLLAHLGTKTSRLGRTNLSVVVVPRTEAPVLPWNACKGVGCSGHGECKMNAKKEATCSCSAGWFQKDCDDTPLRMTISNISECGGETLELDSFGMQQLQCHDMVLRSTGVTEVMIAVGITVRLFVNLVASCRKSALQSLLFLLCCIRELSATVHGRQYSPS